MTSTFNPIIGRVEISVWNPLARPEPEPGVAVVLMRDGRPTHVLMPDDKHVSRGIKWSNYQRAYYVDVSEHTLTFQCRLPCALPEHHFEAEVYIAYWASDPRMIVQRKITDARAIVEPDLMRRIRSISRDYMLDQCAEAEADIQAEILKKPFLPEFTITRFSVGLHMEEDERAHIRRLRALQRNHEYSMQFAEYREQGSIADINHARLHIRFYNELVKSGYGQLLLLHLANNREEVQPVLQGLNQQLQLDRDHWLKMFNLLREADGLEEFQFDDLREQVLKRLTEGDGKNGASAPKADHPEPKNKHDGQNGASAPNVDHPAPATGETVIEAQPPRERAVGSLET